MATSFPSGLDSFTNPSPGDGLSSPSHAGQHADVNDAVEALQAKVGVDGSADTSSLDYKVAQQGLTLIDEVTATAQQNVSLVGCFSSTFQNYRITFDCLSAGSTTDLHFRFLTGTTERATSDYWWQHLGHDYNGSSFNTNAANFSFGYTGCSAAVAFGNEDMGGFMDVFSPYLVKRTITTGIGTGTTTAAFYMRTGSSGYRPQQSHDGIKFFAGSAGNGSISGTIKVYGYGNP